jgi:hypothetical protein
MMRVSIKARYRKPAGLGTSATTIAVGFDIPVNRNDYVRDGRFRSDLCRAAALRYFQEFFGNAFYERVIDDSQQWEVILDAVPDGV